VHLTIVVPRRLSEAQREVLEDVKEAFHYEPELSGSGPDRRETRKRKKAGSGFFDRLRDALEGE
jgi:DnaJ-class molecular chaperone